MTQPRISIIVPVYNLEAYLEKTVTMLMEQTYRNLEIILVDDGSTDATPEICDRLAAQDPRIVVFHTPNRGVSAARNLGMKAASSDYIGFCDGDDQLEKDMYEYLYQLLRDADADISVCGVQIRYEGASGKNTVKGYDGVFSTPQDAIRKLLSAEMSISLYTKLFRADVIRDLYLPEDIRLREDEYYCYAAFARARRIASGKLAKYIYIRREGSASMSAFSEKHYDILKVCSRLRTEIGQAFPELKPQLTAKMLKELMHVYKLMIVRKAGAVHQAAGNEICRRIRNDNWAPVTQYLTPKEKICYYALKCSKPLYRLLVRINERR